MAPRRPTVTAAAATPGLTDAVSAAAVELLDASGQGLLNALARKAFKPLEARLMAKLQAECSGKAHPLVRAHTLLPELEEMARAVAKRVHDEGQRAVRDALIAVNPELDGRIDRLGNALDAMERELIAPYIEYDLLEELALAEACALEEPGKTVADCFEARISPE